MPLRVASSETAVVVPTCLRYVMAPDRVRLLPAEVSAVLVTILTTLLSQVAGVMSNREPNLYLEVQAVPLSPL